MKKFKGFKFALLSILTLLVVWKGFYVEKLSDRKKVVANSFDAKQLAQKIWKEQLPGKLDAAISVQEFLAKTKDNNATSILTLTNSLSIGNIRYAILTAEGTVFDLTEDGFMLELVIEGRKIKLPVEMEYVYGNAVRDASGSVKVEDYPISEDLNSISENLNSFVREDVLPPLKKELKEGARLRIVAAVEMNTAHFRPENFSFIPLRYTILP
jgi:predicted lipoprotein